MKPATIVLIDDEPLQRETLGGFLAKGGHRVIESPDGEHGVAAVSREVVDVVITDLRMPGLSGIDVLKQVRQIHPDVAVIVLTAFGTVSGAVEALQLGAAHYLTKPIDLDELELVLARIMEKRDLIRENRALRRTLRKSDLRFQMIGRSAALQEVLGRAARAAETDATVLIRGQSGTGKELMARSIHALSRRALGPFVAINCAALPETLLESELFGHERGAFTSADRRHVGRVEAADGGTLFLDEIGDMSAAVQAKLLRFLQEREFTRVGGEQTLHADVRVVAATHRDLEALIRDGGFREDLYYRLNVVSLTLPPLRERREDIPELVEQFTARFSKHHNRPVSGVSREAMYALVKYDYPGNIRELENIIEQATILARDELITVEDLPRSIALPDDGDVTRAILPESISGNLSELLGGIERRIVLGTLSRHHGNQSETARQLGITESGLRYKLGRWRSRDRPGVDKKPAS